MFDDDPIKEVIEGLKDDDSPHAKALVAMASWLLELSSVVMGAGADVDFLRSEIAN